MMNVVSKASMAAVAALCALAIVAPAANADSVTFAVNPSAEDGATAEESYSKVWQQVSEAAAARRTAISFDGTGVDYSTWRDVVDNMRISNCLGRYGKRHSDTITDVDRFGIDTYAGIDTVLSAVGDDLITTGARLSYYDTKLVKKAQRVEDRVAKRAKAIKSKKKRLTYIHDWVVRNTAYEGYASAKWSKASAYGVKASMVSRTSIGPLVGHRGTCHSYTLAFMRLAKASGFKSVRYVECLAPSGKLHAMAAVKSGGTWLYVDCTWDEVCFTPSSGVKTERANKVSHKYLLKSAKYMLRHGYTF